MCFVFLTREGNKTKARARNYAATGIALQLATSLFRLRRARNLPSPSSFLSSLPPLPFPLLSALPFVVTMPRVISPDLVFPSREDMHLFPARDLSGNRPVKRANPLLVIVVVVVVAREEYDREERVAAEAGRVFARCERV